MTASPTLEKFVDELPVPQYIHLSSITNITIGAYKITQKLHRDLPATPLYAYGTSEATASYPGPTLVAERGIPVCVRWENHINDSDHMFTIDRTVNWADPPNGGVPTVTHLHGATNPSTSDGHPDAWFTQFNDTGPTWSTPVYFYPNEQFPTMLWYHDHTFGITRLNNYAGLAGAYILTWPRVEAQFNLPSGDFDIPLIIQDRQFYPNGSLNYPNVGQVPETRPNWCPAFFGDTILVNGMVWPFLTVQARKYRFRFLNAANSRVFTLYFNSSNLYFTRIGTDGGFLQFPFNSSSMTLAPANRVDAIVDFSSIPNGTDILLMNSARSPFPNGGPPSGGTEMVMNFRVVSAESEDITLNIPSIFKNLSGSATLTRSLTLDEVFNDQGLASEFLLNKKSFHDPVTEYPQQGTAEIWELINLADNAHPIHIHLVQFQMLNAQEFNVTSYQNDSCSLAIPYNSSGSCFTEAPRDPGPDEIGYKDTIIAMPGNVTRLFLNFTPQNVSKYSFNSSVGPGYVWHCHILEHEDNEMMRPFILRT